MRGSVRMEPIRWAERSGQRVVIRVEQFGAAWTSVVTIQWQRLAEGVLFPAEATIERWFGEDWGPEVYTYDLEVEDDG